MYRYEHDELNAASLKTFRNRLEALRTQHAHNIDKFCKETTIPRRTYNSWTLAHENKNSYGYNAPSIENALIIARTYHVSLDYLFGLSDFTSPERDFIGKEIGLDDNAIKSLQTIKKAEPDVIPYINFIIGSLHIVDIVNRFKQLINPVQEIPVYVNPDTNELYPITENVFNNGSRKNVRMLKYKPSDGKALGFNSELIEQTALNKISDLFRSMRDTWNKTHKNKN